MGVTIGVLYKQEIDLDIKEETYFFQAKCSDNKCNESRHSGDEAWQEVRSVD